MFSNGLYILGVLICFTGFFSNFYNDAYPLDENHHRHHHFKNYHEHKAGHKRHSHRHHHHDKKHEQRAGTTEFVPFTIVPTLPSGAAIVVTAGLGVTSGPENASTTPMPTHAPAMYMSTDGNGGSTLIPYPGNLSFQISGGEGGNAAAGNAGSFGNLTDSSMGGIANSVGGAGNNATGGGALAVGGDTFGDLLSGGDTIGGTGGTILVGDNVDTASASLQGANGGDSEGGFGGIIDNMYNSSLGGGANAVGGVSNGTGSIGGIANATGGLANYSLALGGIGTGGNGGTINVTKVGDYNNSLVQGGGANGGMGIGGGGGGMQNVTNSSLGGVGNAEGGAGQEQGAGGAGIGNGGYYIGNIGGGGNGEGGEGGDFNIQFGNTETPISAIARRVAMHIGGGRHAHARALEVIQRHRMHQSHRHSAPHRAGYGRYVHHDKHHEKKHPHHDDTSHDKNKNHH